jgi:hypothetical protein
MACSKSALTLEREANDRQLMPRTGFGDGDGEVE